MTSKERVLTALNLGTPDKVPYMEIGIDEEFGKKLLNRTNPVYYEDFLSIEGLNPLYGYIGWNYYSPPQLCEELRLDAWGYHFLPEILPRKDKTASGQGEREFITGGKIKDKNDLKKVHLADLKNENVFEYVNNYINKYKRDYAVFVVTNIGTDPLLFNLGWETFSYALYDDISLIEEVLDFYGEWLVEAVQKLCGLDIDFIWFADDIAYKNGLMFRPDFYREICLPRIRKVTGACTKPWVYHTDGNFLEILEDLLNLGMNGIHPIEPGAIDIFDFKETFGLRVCTIGNIDLHTLSLGSEEEVNNEVKEKLSALSMGGSYIMSSSNTITEYCRVENVKAMVEALTKYR